MPATALGRKKIYSENSLLRESDEVLVVGVHVSELDIDQHQDLVFASLQWGQKRSKLGSIECLNATEAPFLHFSSLCEATLVWLTQLFWYKTEHNFQMLT